MHATSPLLLGIAISLALLQVIPGLRLASIAQAQQPAVSASTNIRIYLESKLAQNPNDAGSWRLLGRVYRQLGDRQRAAEAFRQSLQLATDSAATHADYAELLMELNQLAEAADHFTRAVQLAPESEYARTARQHLPHLPPPRDPAVVPASYEIKNFDGSDRVEPTDPETFFNKSLRRLSARIEAGALYNTNVTLTPTSRSFFSSEAASFQGFINPDLEFRIWNGDLWRSGPTFTGYFSVNENQFRELNLQSYQPGYFFERSILLESAIVVPRVQYIFTHDAFNGIAFGDRHGLTTSVTTLWDQGDTTIAYWGIDTTNFADDGTSPAETSRDGVTNTLGISHQHVTDFRLLQSVAAGVDIEMVDTEGTDFSYNGVGAYVEGVVPITATLVLTLEAGWGYRDYYRSDLTPTRNEHIWRASSRLEKSLTDHWSIAGVFNYNEFDSQNDAFDAQRAIAGVVSVFEY